jgi:hypothetical protein
MPRVEPRRVVEETTVRIGGRGELSENERAGAGLRAGDRHYRAYVGPPEDYDLVAAMTFNLLTSLGLRQHHRLLDIGCGSLRLGRLLIPYLNPSGYFGVEPNKWLVDDGIANELGADLIRLKRPTICYGDTLGSFSEPLRLDFALAQSIFSHCSQRLIGAWLADVRSHLTETGALLATFIPAETDFTGDGWIYPSCVHYRPATLAALAAEQGLQFTTLDWHHPRQTWALFACSGFDRRGLRGQAVHWNHLFAR